MVVTPLSVSGFIIKAAPDFVNGIGCDLKLFKREIRQNVQFFKNRFIYFNKKVESNFFVSKRLIF